MFTFTGPRGVRVRGVFDDRDVVRPADCTAATLQTEHRLAALAPAAQARGAAWLDGISVVVGTPAALAAAIKAETLPLYSVARAPSTDLCSTQVCQRLATSCSLAAHARRRRWWWTKWTSVSLRQRATALRCGTRTAPRRCGGSASELVRPRSRFGTAIRAHRAASRIDRGRRRRQRHGCVDGSGSRARAAAGARGGDVWGCCPASVAAAPCSGDGALALPPIAQCAVRVR